MLDRLVEESVAGSARFEGLRLAYTLDARDRPRVYR
jgi:hypothetical protein